MINVGGDMVPSPCSPSHDGLYFMSSAVFKFRSNTISILKIIKGHKSNQCVGGINVSVFSVLYTCICTKFYKISYKGIKWIQLSYLKLQKGIILSNGSSSQHIHYDVLYLYHIFSKYLQRF